VILITWLSAPKGRRSGNADGHELPDREAATAEAAKALTEIAKEALPLMVPQQILSFTVRNEQEPALGAATGDELIGSDGIRSQDHFDAA
jgi:uncharacterized protein DUF6894